MSEPTPAWGRSRAPSGATGMRMRIRRGPVLNRGRAVLAALWLAFLGIVVRGAAPEMALVRKSGRFMMDLGAVIIIVAGLSVAIDKRWEIRGKKPYSVLVMLFLCAAAALHGLVRAWTATERMYFWLQNGTLAFCSLLVVFLMDEDGLSRKLVRHLFLQMCVASVVGARVLMFAAPSDRMEWNGETGEGVAKLAVRSMFMIPFVAAYVDELRGWKAYVLAIAFLQWLVLALAGAGRGLIIAAALIVPMTLTITGFRTATGLKPLRRLGATVASFGLVVAVALAIGGRMESAFGYLESKWNESAGRIARVDVRSATASQFWEGAYSTSADEFFGEGGRSGELRDFVEQLDIVDLCIGRGFGGTWVSRFWNVSAWPMVHFGPANLVLMGGLPLLVAFVTLVVGALLRLWRGLGSSHGAAGALTYLLTYLEGFAQHGVVADDGAQYLAWISIGIGLTARDEKGRGG